MKMAKPYRPRAEKQIRFWKSAGLAAMTLLSLTQLAPSLRWAGWSVFVGIGCFFLVEALAQTRPAESGMRFRGFAADLKKPGVRLWVLLPVLTAAAAPLLGDWLFQGAFTAHVIGRADGMLAYDRLWLLVFQVPILAWGEEIGWRGFFLGKAMDRLPFWPGAVFSSALFALGHLSAGSLPVVLFDLGSVFLDSLIFSVIFRKTGNCLASTLAHILGNFLGLAVCFALA